MYLHKEIYRVIITVEHRTAIDAACNSVQSVWLLCYIYIDYWEENATVEECKVTYRIYTHQFYTRLLVIDLFAQRQGTATGLYRVF